MSNVFEVKFNVYPCDIKDGVKIVKTESAPVRVYNPFNYYNKDSSINLHLQFASIDINNHKKILDFVCKYGFLGLNIRYRFKKMQEDIMLLTYKYINSPINLKAKSNDWYQIGSVADEIHKLNLNSNLEMLEGLITEENLADISHEISKFKNLIDLIRKKEDATMDKLYELVLNVYKDNTDYTIGLNKITTYDPNKVMECSLTKALLDKDLIAEINDEAYGADLYTRRFVELNNQHGIDNLNDLKQEANNLIAFVINKEIADASPNLVLDANSDSGLKPVWHTKTLISALYTMLYLDLVGKIMFKKCKNVNCNKFFAIYGNDERKIFCSPECSRAHTQREYRRRKKKEKKVK